MSTPSSWSAAWPTKQVMPSSRRAARTGESTASLPLTSTPCCAMSRAIADSPAPPMPMKCTCPSRSTGGISSGIGILIERHAHDHVGEPHVGVAAHQVGGGAGHHGQARGVGDQRHEHPVDPGGRERLVVDEQRSPGADHRVRVVRLLAVADRQRDERRGQADRRHLGDGVGAGPAHDEVGGGVGEVDAVDEPLDHVRRIARTALDDDLFRTSGRVQHLDAGVGEVVGGSGHREVDATGALGATRDEERGPVGLEAEVLAGLVAHRRPVEAGDLPADRQADVGGVRQVGAREAGGDVLGEPRAQLVGDAGDRVALVHDDGHVPAPGHQVGRHRDVAAEADHDVGTDAVEDVGRWPWRPCPA